MAPLDILFHLLIKQIHLYYIVYTIDGKEMNKGKTILYDKDSVLYFIKPKIAGIYIIYLITDGFE